MSIKALVYAHEEARHAAVVVLGPEWLTDDPAEANYLILPTQEGWTVLGNFEGSLKWMAGRCPTPLDATSVVLERQQSM